MARKRTSWIEEKEVSSPSWCPLNGTATWHSAHLVGGDLGARNSVALEVAVDVGSVARVGGLDVSRDLGGRRGLAAAATSDLELGARDVELRWAAGVVDTELLDTEEVLSSGDLGRNRG
jgi:hypothetical protein